MLNKKKINTMVAEVLDSLSVKGLYRTSVLFPGYGANDLNKLHEALFAEAKKHGLVLAFTTDCDYLPDRDWLAYFPVTQAQDTELGEIELLVFIAGSFSQGIRVASINFRENGSCEIVDNILNNDKPTKFDLTEAKRQQIKDAITEADVNNWQDCYKKTGSIDITSWSLKIR